VGEAVIVADRVAFLVERGHTAGVASMFDPKVSARNWVITAGKCEGGGKLAPGGL
jgi:hypothetical protein